MNCVLHRKAHVVLGTHSHQTFSLHHGHVIKQHESLDWTQIDINLMRATKLFIRIQNWINSLPIYVHHICLL